MTNSNDAKSLDTPDSSDSGKIKKLFQSYFFLKVQYAGKKWCSDCPDEPPTHSFALSH